MVVLKYLPLSIPFTVLFLCQGKANSKIKACEDKEEGDLTVSNCNHAINDNSCGDMATDSDNKVEGSPKLPEEDDEPRPTKKAKSAVDEEYCTGKEDNGCPNFSLSGTYISWVFTYCCAFVVYMS